MAMGLLLIGMLAGMLAAAGALIAGMGVWAALAVYAAVGAAGILLGAGLAVMPRPALPEGIPSRA